MKIVIDRIYGDGNPGKSFLFKEIMKILGIKINIRKKAFRKELAEELDKLEPNFSINDARQSIYTDLIEGKIKYIKYREDPNTIRFKYNSGTVPIDIVEIDENRIYRINCYENYGEYIEYWNPEPKLVNPEIGEYEW